MPEAARVTVLHYLGYDGDGGGIVTLVRVLAATGRFNCILGTNPGCLQRRHPPLPQLSLPPIKGEKVGPLNFWRARQVALAVKPWLAEADERVFHGHSRAGLLVALWLQRMGERRVVVSVHCYGRQRWFYRWAARRLEPKFFWLSPAMRNYYGMPGRDWEQCIPGGVLLSPIQPICAEPGRLRLGGIGAVERWKRWDLVLRAIAALPQGARERVSFTHIGVGDFRYTEELKEFATMHGLAGQIAFRCSEPSSEGLLSEIDALVIASRNEPFSMSMLEALAAGVPVLATDTGGARDVVRDGVNGHLYRAGDPVALAALLSEWLEHSPDWDREKIRNSTIPISRVAAQWAKVYSELR